MDSSKKYIKVNPKGQANILSKIFFWWLLPFIARSSKSDIEMKDVFNILDSEKSSILGDKLQKNWNTVCKEAQRNGKKPSLVTAIRRTFLRMYIPGAILYFCKVIILTYGMPIVLTAFIDYFNEKQRDPMKVMTLGGVVLLVSFANTILSHHSHIYNRVVGMKVAVACSSLVYRKVLRLNKTTLDETDVGNIVNLLSNDIARFETPANMNNIWVMPIVSILGTVIIYQQVGPAAFIGIGAMIIQAVPIQGYLSRLQGKFRFRIAKKTDVRVKLMNEITNGIQVIKMYAWEKPFEQIVEHLRRKEIATITKTTYIKSFSTALQVFTERVTLYLIVIISVILGNELSGEVVFSTAQLINSLQLIVCILFPLALTAFAEAKTSVFRLEEFLLKSEKENTERSLDLGTEPGFIGLSHVHASWTSNPIVETLIDISFELPPGSFCCIVGNIGSGKTSIFNLLLKELPILSGKMRVEGKISYASQEPWLFVSNIRNNILFGQPFLKDRYYRVVRACALERDLELFPFGDKTLVGEKGVSLSGGQRARINLARAVYRNSDIYLFDDPLSAVDPHVAKHLLEKCFLEYLKDKTRILITHQTQFLNRADFIMVLNNGKIEKFAKSSQFSPQDLDLIREVSCVESKTDSTSELHVGDTEIANTSYIDNIIEVENAPLASPEIFKSLNSIISSDSNNEPSETQELISKESIGFQTYKTYFGSGTNCIIILFEIFLILVAQLFCNSCDLWLTFWTNNVAKKREAIIMMNKSDHYLNQNSNGTSANQVNITTNLNSTNSSYIDAKANMLELDNFDKLEIFNRDMYIWVYTAFICIAILLTIARSALFFKICMNSSKKLHDVMFSNILEAKMRFFDVNPSGRILNRFSKDMGAVDELLPFMMLMTVQSLMVGVGILGMVFYKSYYMIIPAIVLGIMTQWIRKVFFKVAQNVKRIEGVAKAPVFSYLSASLDGLLTIRSSYAEEMVKREFDTLQDQHTSTNYLFIYTFQAFGFYLDMISIFFLAALILQFSFDMNAMSGDVGLLISQSLIVVNMVQFFSINATEVANNMTGVERILQYTKLDKEGPFQSLPAYKPPKSWPEAGRITFKNVFLRYIMDEEPVLKNLNLEIKSGQKIGIVGRTGAGKSTLISALFRLAPTEGSIQIDGIDIEKIGLTDLRSNISIIPQEPVLFSESIRYNLDPFNKIDDETLWNALKAVELKHSVKSLDMTVNEGGSNFSAGQRQLICLARAIVRNNRILVMDEATANVDPHTDGLIQKSIRENFENCTVLTVAHRLNTIMDSDKVIVMDAGEMKEFASPHELLENSGSYFSYMVRETGNDMEKKLRKIAADHFMSNKIK